jgi:biotin-dependent carboxylase-like uncharacterized protein
MNVIDVLDGGLFTTVQDAGRFGFQRYGVPVSGAMDVFALRAANRLAGNDEAAAGLEITLLGPQLRFLAPGSFALAGADLGATLDGRPVPSWETVTVSAGQTLAFAGPRDGARAYLAVSGGINVPLVLGSRSTYTRSQLGGFEGRSLKAGDVLQTGVSGPVVDATRRRVPSSRRPTYGHDHRLRVVIGPQNDRFTNAGLLTFFCSTYTVTPQSDRMGCRLSGPRIEHTAGSDIVSDGSPLGGVQVAGDGVPIVLMADRGTAGGYTKIATVISVDVSRLAQAAPGDTVRFEAVSIEEALAARREQNAWLDEIVTTGAKAVGDRHRKVAIAAAVVARLFGDEA